jgi:hypothetical protein
MDEQGVINVWVVMELPEIDWVGSESDLGQSIGSRLKVVKSASLRIKIDPEMRAFDFQFFPRDPNQ